MPQTNIPVVDRYASEIAHARHCIVKLREYLRDLSVELTRSHHPAIAFHIPMQPEHTDKPLQYISVTPEVNSHAARDKIAQLYSQIDYVAGQHEKYPLRMAGIIEATDLALKLLEPIEQYKKSLKACVVQSAKSSDTRKKIIRAAAGRLSTLQAYRRIPVALTSVSRASFYWECTNSITTHHAYEIIEEIEKQINDKTLTPNGDYFLRKYVSQLNTLDPMEVLARKRPTNAHPICYIGKGKDRQMFQASLPIMVPLGTLHGCDINPLTDYDSTRQIKHDEVIVERVPFCEPLNLYRYVKRRFEKGNIKVSHANKATNEEKKSA